MTNNKFEQWRQTGEAADWHTDESLNTLSRGYLIDNESPKDMYKRLAAGAAKELDRPDLEGRFFDLFWNNWLCPATPVSSNFNSSRGLPISCYCSHVEDSTDSIFNNYHEGAMLTKNGGGLGKYWGDVRGSGVSISGGGSSTGVVPWLKIEDQIISGIAQSSTRRGASANYLPIDHVDIEEFLDIRRQTGDVARRCRSLGFHHAVCIDDYWMEELVAGDLEKRRLWSKLLVTRFETGEPYIMFRGNANNQAPQMYKDLGLEIKSSNLCSEIMLHTSKDSTFVCCLSSLNLVRYDEWKETDTVELAIYFLDAVMSEFIRKAKKKVGFKNAVRFAEKSRALGLGVLGWHELLQRKHLPFDSFESMQLNNEIFRLMKEDSYKASAQLASKYGEPDWCKGYGVRNTHTLAVAPTLSNSIISGVFSEGIQPVISNTFAQKTAKGTFIRRNPVLEEKLSTLGKNNIDVWSEINANKGSVKTLDFLSEEDKNIFKTAREINQFSLIKQAAQRQRYIDQGQSLNLFFTQPETGNTKEEMIVGRYVHETHLEAWKLGLKSLYYLKSESAIKGDSMFSASSDCAACEG